MTTSKKILHIFKFAIFSIFLFFSITVNAQLIQSENTTNIGAQSEALRQTAGFADPAGNTGNIGGIAETIIMAFLSILAIIFIILVIIAGYSWMTAAGEESKVTYAKDTIKRAIIGLVIIAAAYAITAFIFSNISMGDIRTNSDGTIDGM